MANSNIWCGIDLGTTYSCIARIDEHNQPVVLKNMEGDDTTPSVVYFENAENRVVGKTAAEAADYPTDRENVVFTVKRRMGDKEWKETFHGEEYTPQRVSSIILRKLVKDALESLETEGVEEIKDVVITCPAYFGTEAQQATKQAGELAGLNVHYVIPEPTAAAFAYGLTRHDEPDRTVFVYDLGGGTFDVTVMRLGGDNLKVVCSNGDHQLGGKDWDLRVAKWAADEFARDFPGFEADDLLEDGDTAVQLMKKAEEAKRALSAREQSRFAISHGGETATLTLTRETFEAITEDLRERTIALSEECLETAADKGWGQVDRVLLVGGSTLMPQIKAAVEERFPEEFRSADFKVERSDPHMAVAKGAALMAWKCQIDDDINNWIREMIAAEQGVTKEDVSDEQVKKAKENEEFVKGGEHAMAEKHDLTIDQVKGVTRKQVSNVASKSLGVVISMKEEIARKNNIFAEADKDGDVPVVRNIIRIHEEVPLQRKRPFATKYDNQSSAPIRVIESEQTGELFDEAFGEEIGIAEMELPPGVPAGTPLEIQFSLGDDGLLQLFAKVTEESIEAEVRAEFRCASLMSAEDIERVRESEEAKEVT